MKQDTEKGDKEIVFVIFFKHSLNTYLLIVVCVYRCLLYLMYHHHQLYDMVWLTVTLIMKF